MTKPILWPFIYDFNETVTLHRVALAKQKISKDNMYTVIAVAVHEGEKNLRLTS
jgi:hypothetical protein